MAKVPKVFAVIVTYNGEEWIKKCLDSLLYSSVKPHVVVVDNNSVDRSKEVLKKYGSRVTIFWQTENLGFGRANNVGIKYALDQGADYLFLLNQDAWLVNAMQLEKLLSIHIANPNYGILTPVHLSSEETTIDDNFRLYMFQTKRLLSDLYIGALKPVYPTEFANAAAWLISSKCVRTIGLFDPFFFHYSEDRNYCHRVLFHGFKIGICPGIKVVHQRAGFRETKGQYLFSDERFREELTDLLDVRRSTDFKQEYERSVARWRKTLFKSILKRNGKGVAVSWRNLVTLKRRRREMIASIEKNRIGGDEYGLKQTR